MQGQQSFLPSILPLDHARCTMFSGDKIRANTCGPCRHLAPSGPFVVSWATCNQLRAFRGLLFQKLAQHPLETTQLHTWWAALSPPGTLFSSKVTFVEENNTFWQGKTGNCFNILPCVWLTFLSLPETSEAGPYTAPLIRHLWNWDHWFMENYAQFDSYGTCPTTTHSLW